MPRIRSERPAFDAKFPQLAAASQAALLGQPPSPLGRGPEKHQSQAAEGGQQGGS